MDMFCINCLHQSTRVTNSRPHKKQPTIWRRRTCPNCRSIFTTIERPDLTYSKILRDDHKLDFNLGKLIISIANAFQHDREKGIEYASALSDTVQTRLSLLYEITPEMIRRETYRTLERFDTSAALAYKLQHKLTD